MADINQEMEHLVSEMRKLGDMPAPVKGGSYNSIIRYRESRERILEEFLSAFEAGYRLEMPALTPPNEAEKAIQRLGNFGKLFLDYSGCPRGPMGEPGASTVEEWATIMEPIQDVDGGWWRPVPEKAVQKMLSEMKSLKQAAPPDHFRGVAKMVQDNTNEPLTLDELRKMNGEPVWVVVSENWRNTGIKDGWRLVRFHINDDRVRLYMFDTRAGARFFAEQDMGRSYWVYRRPPEGEADE